MNSALQRVLVLAAACASAAEGAAPTFAGVQRALNRNVCVGCHSITKAVVGPASRDVAARHQDRRDLESYLAQKIKTGG